MKTPDKRHLLRPVIMEKPQHPLLQVVSNLDAVVIQDMANLPGFQRERD